MTDPNLAHPHDLFVRRFLVEVDLMAGLISNYVDPKVVSLLDLTALRCESPVHIDEKLVERRGDLRFTTNFKGTHKPSAVFVLLEHQSTRDRFFPFRVLEYMVRDWRSHLDKTGETGLLPYPIIIVLYHGKKPWSKFPSMSNLIESVPGIDTNILNFKIWLIDLARIPMDEIKGDPVLIALFETLKSASEGTLEKHFDHVTDQLGTVKNDRRAYDWLRAIIHYTMAQCRPLNAREMILTAFRKVAGNEEEAKKMETSFVAELIGEGRMEGRIEGRMEGILAFLEARFGDIPKQVRNAVTTCTDQEKLNDLIRLAATCDSMDEFQQGLPQT